MAAVALAVPASAGAIINISPGLDCVTYNATAAQAHYRLVGLNVDGIIENILTGDDNFFDPSPMDRGQPNQYLPGRTFFELSVAAGAPTTTWSLEGHTLALSPAFATLPFERPCPDRGAAISAVEPSVLTIGADAQTLTVFGQDLQGAQVSFGGADVDAGAPTSTSANRIDVPVLFEAGAAPGTRDVFVLAADGTEIGCRACAHFVAAGTQASLPAGPQGAAGQDGAAGADGKQGATGPAGAAGTGARVTRVTGKSRAVRPGRFAKASATCPKGTTLVSGGYELTPADGADPPRVTRSRPAGVRAWVVAARGGGKPFSLRAYASCIGA